MNIRLPEHPRTWQRWGVIFKEGCGRPYLHDTYQDAVDMRGQSKAEIIFGVFAEIEQVIEPGESK